MSRGPQQLVRPEILALKAYHVADAEGLVKLDAMELPYRLPEDMRRQLGAYLAEAEINRYPEPTGLRLRKLIAERMNVPEGMDILLGNGSDDLIQIVTLTLARRDAVVMFPEPTFVMYRMNAVFSAMRAVAVPLREDFTLDADAFIAQMKADDPALVYIAYPNNPTGVLYPEADVARIVREAPGLVVLDEAYHVYAGRSFMPRLTEFPNLVVMRTVSKLGLAGIRLGYLAARPEWVQEFNKVRQAYNVNVLTQAAGEFAMQHMDVFEDQAAKVREARDALGAALAALPGVTVFPSQANFFLVRVPDADRTFGRLRERGVLVRNFSGAHPLLANCLRVTVGTGEENVRLLDALGKSL